MTDFPTDIQVQAVRLVEPATDFVTRALILGVDSLRMAATQLHELAFQAEGEEKVLLTRMAEFLSAEANSR